MTQRNLLFLLLLFFTACARAPLVKQEDAMRLSSDSISLADDLTQESLVAAIDENIAYLEKNNNKTQFVFGPKVLTKAEYLFGLKHFLDLAHTISNREDFFKAVKDDFDFYEVYGGDHWGEVLITGYYHPLVEGSLRKTKKYTQPIYQDPGDIVEVNFKDYKDIRADLAELSSIRGRLDTKEKGRTRLLPYYDRHDIDVRQALKGKHLELCWVDPLDSFVLQIQGSGTVRLPDGKEIRLGYAQQNGQPYVPIGKFLTDKIPLEEMSMQRIEAYLRSIPEEAMNELLYKNPSYVFFKKLSGSPLSYLGTPVVDQRTIATDAKFFPKGTLAFLSFEKPVLDSPQATNASAWTATQRFVIDNDTGGAIRGGGHIDLYFGESKEAEQMAGVMKRNGHLYYLVPKDKVFH